MAYRNILYEKIDSNIIKVTMNRPEKRNAQDPLMLQEMQDAFIQADLDEEVRVIILAGAGKDFSGGHDMTFKGQPAEGLIGQAMQTRLTGMEKWLKNDQYLYINQALAMRNVSKPTIAMVQGNAIAGGWLNASMCDLIVASEDAKFIDPVVRMTAAGVEILIHPYDVGFRRAKEALWTGDPITAQEAKQLGLVSRVVPREKLEEETLALARKIAKTMPVAASLVKRSINDAWDLMGQRDAWNHHFLIHLLGHSSDETHTQWVERQKVLNQGGVKEWIKQRDTRFEEGEGNKPPTGEAK